MICHPTVTLEGAMLDTARETAWDRAIDCMGDIAVMCVEVDHLVRLNEACQVLASLGSLWPEGPRPATLATSASLLEVHVERLRTYALYQLEGVVEDMDAGNWQEGACPETLPAALDLGSRLSALVAYIDEHTGDGETTADETADAVHAGGDA